MPAFAEEGRAAEIPGPLVRVRAGTEAEVNVRNTLRDTLRVHGLHARAQSGPVDATPLVLAPGEQRMVRFQLDAPGEVTPEAAGDMRLEVRLGPPWPAPSTVLTTVPIRVGPAESHPPR